VFLIKPTTLLEKLFLAAFSNSIHETLYHCPRVQGRKLVDHLLGKTSRLPLARGKKTVHLNPRLMIEQGKEVVMEYVERYGVHVDYFYWTAILHFFGKEARGQLITNPHG
jgi:hypothetical protein